jgi:hypothetical protein
MTTPPVSMTALESTPKSPPDIGRRREASAGAAPRVEAEAANLEAQGHGADHAP